MGSAHSEDLRERVVAAVAAGSSRRSAASRFQVSAASAVRWTALEKETGSVRPRRRPPANPSPLDAHATWLLELVAKEPGLTLVQTEQRLLGDLGVKTSERSIRRFYKRHRITFKKTLHAAEQDRPDVAAARERWKAGQPGLDPSKLVFIDETGTNTKMVRLYGRAPRGQRAVDKQPWGHWKTATPPSASDVMAWWRRSSSTGP